LITVGEARDRVRGRRPEAVMIFGREMTNRPRARCCRIAGSQRAGDLDNRSQ